MAITSSATNTQSSASPGSVLVYKNAHALLLSAIVLIGAIDGIWLHSISLQLDLRFLWRLAPVALILSLFWAFYRFVRCAPHLAITLLVALELLTFTNVCGILSYLIMGIGWPWRDGLFASWDRFLGVDWPAYTAFIEHVPWLYRFLGYLYDSSIAQIAVLTLVLGYRGHFRELVEFLGIIIFGGIIAIVVGAMLPALGAYQYFNLPDHGRASYVPAIIGAHDRTLAGLDPLHLEGLVVFPSYHTILSIGIILAGWRLPYLRYPVIIANLLLIAGVPVFGGHYFVDVLGGSMAAVAIVWIWRSVVRAIDARAVTSL
jgi:hypothetical protein